MNRIYSLVFNRALRQVQVGSEHASRRRGGAARSRLRTAALAPGALALALAGLPAAAQVLPGEVPTGQTIVGGIGNISVDDATMTIEQTQQRAVIIWDTFNIGEDAQVIFDQAADHIALNQIWDADASQILGGLEAGGTVFLVNPNGIVFGESAQVNVGGLVASTLSVDEEDFLELEDGAYLFDELDMDPSGTPAAIVNRGTIWAGAQGVTLVGGHVFNDSSGLIQAQAGNVDLLGTQTATLSFDGAGLVSVAVLGALSETVAGAAAVVENRGHLQASDGRVYLHANTAAGILGNAVNNQGMIRALAIDTDAGDNVVLVGGTGGMVLGGDIDTDGLGLRITSADTVSLSGGIDAGELRVDAFGGLIQFGGSVAVSGDAGIDTGSASIILSSASNDFTGRVGLRGGAATIHDANTLALGTVSVSSLDAAAAAIHLGDDIATSGNQNYQGAVVLNDDVALDSGGSITFASTVDGAHALDAGATGSVSFNGAVGATQALAGLTVDAGSFNATSDLSVAGALSITAATGGISQGGAWTVVGTSRLDSVGQTISLTDAGNDFTGAVDLAGGNVSIQDRNDLTLGALDMGGSLTATSNGALGLGGGGIAGNLSAESNGGDIGQSTALTVGGTSTLDAGSGAIVLDDGGNRFANTMHLRGGQTRIGTWDLLRLGSLETGALTVEAGSLELGGDGSVGGDLALTTNAGGIVQDDLATGLHVTGTTTLDSGSHAIVLHNPTNDFDGLVNVTGGTVRIHDANTLALGSVAASSLDVSASTINIGQDIATSGDQRYDGAVALTDDVALSSTDSSIRFLSTVDGPGALSATATSGSVEFQGAVGGSQALGGLVVDAGSLLADADVTITGDLRLTVAEDGIAQGASAAWNVDGDTYLDAADGAIALGNAGNDFVGTVHLTGGDVSIRDMNALTLGELEVDSLIATSQGNLGLGGGDIAGDLEARSHGGDIGQSDALEVGGTSILDAEGGAIALDNIGNDFVGAVDAAGTGIAIIDRNDLTIAALTSGPNGGVRLEAGGTLALPSMSIDTGSADLVLASHGGVLETVGTLNGANVSLTGGAGIGLGHDVSATDALSLHSSNGIVQSAGVLSAGELQLQATGAAMLGGANAVGALGDVEVGGDFTLHNGPAIAQTATGSLSISGEASLESGDAITLTNAGNSFGGAVHLSGGATQIAAAGALQLGDLDVGSLTATSQGDLGLGGGSIAGNLEARSHGGDIDQDGALAVGGTSTVDADGGAIALDDAGNSFGGVVHLSGGATQIAASGALQLGALDVASLTATSQGNLGLGGGSIAGDLEARSHGGDIGQDGALAVVGTSTVDADGGAIALTDAGNSFGGLVHLSGGAAQIAASGALQLGDLGVSALTATSQGNLGLGGGDITGNLEARSHGGDIGQSDALAVGGTSTLDADGGTIALTNAGNDFVGAVDATGTGIAIVDRSDLTIAALTSGPNGGVRLEAGGTLALPSMSIDTGSADLVLASHGGVLETVGTLDGADVSLTGGAGIGLGHDVSAAGALSLYSGDGIVQSAGALSASELHLQAAGTAVLDGANAVGTLGDVEVGGDFTLRNGPAIAQTATGSLSISGEASLESGDAITLTNAGNNFGGAVHLSGGATQIAASGALQLGDLDVGSLVATSQGDLGLGGGSIAGDLEARSHGGDIGQDDALAVSGTSTLDAGDGDIALTNAGNSFGDVVHLSGDATQIAASGALQLGDLDVTSLVATSQGDLGLGSGSIAGNLEARSHGGDIGQSDALAVGGTSTLDAGGGAIALDDAGNSFGGVVHLSGGATQIAASGALQLGDLDVASLTATSQGDLGLGGGSIAGNLEARSHGGDIGQSDALAVGGTSTLDADGGAIALTNAGNDFVGAVDAVGTGIAIVDANDLTIAALANGANGGVTLIAGGTLTLPATSIDTGTADLVLESRGGDLETSATLAGTNVRILGRDGITLGDTVHGNRIDLATDGLFVNNAGTQALVAADSWRVYLSSPFDDHLFGGLDSGNTALWNRAAFDAVSAAQGNRYVFAYQPTLTLASTDVSKTYGQTIDLGDAYTVSGLMEGVSGAYLADTLESAAAGVPALDSAGAGATATVAGGPYAIDIGTGSMDVSGSGYAVALQGTGLLTVDRAALTVTAGDAAKTYGQAATLDDYTVDGLLNDDAVASVELGSAGSGANANAGDYAITVDNAEGSGLSNYDITYVGGVLVVGLARLTIIAHDVIKPWGQIALLDGYSTEGLVNADSVDHVVLQSDGMTAPSMPGQYAIVASDAEGTGLSNYDITYVDGTLAVLPGDGSGPGTDVVTRTTRAAAHGGGLPAGLPAETGTPAHEVIDGGIRLPVLCDPDATPPRDCLSMRDR